MVQIDQIGKFLYSFTRNLQTPLGPKIYIHISTLSTADFIDDHPDRNRRQNCRRATLESDQDSKPRLRPDSPQDLFEAEPQNLYVRSRTRPSQSKVTQIGRFLWAHQHVQAKSGYFSHPAV